MTKIKVGIVGYGTIGKRVADAVRLQEDMELIGITANSYNYRIDIAQDKGIPIFALDKRAHLEEYGIDVVGNMSDLISKVDVICDCSPKPHGSENKALYKEAGVKGIFQGGEKPTVGDVSFVAQCNYKEAINKDFIRVVSCNTTGMSRTLKVLDDLYGVESARATLIRRGTDPGEIKRGPINAIVPSLELPSHHGPDVLTVMPHLNVFTTAVVVPTTIMHMHNLSVLCKKTPKVDEIVKAFNDKTRIRIVKHKAKILSTAHIVELGRDLGYMRGDMMDICVWEEGIGVYGNEVFYMQAVHQESDVVPESIDAIRAAMGFEDAEESIRRTNKSLGLK